MVVAVVNPADEWDVVLSEVFSVLFHHDIKLSFLLVLNVFSTVG